MHSLQIAASEGHSKVFYYLLEHLVQGDTDDAVQSLLEVVTWQDGEGNTVFHHLCEDGADPPEKDVQDDMEEAPKMMLLLGVCHEVQQITEKQVTLRDLVNRPNSRKKRPLDCCRSYATARLLLKGKADPTNSVALMQAHANIPLLELLLKRRADINAKPFEALHDGQLLPLHQAVADGDVPLVEQLVQMRADIQLTDADGRSAMAHASIMTMISYLKSKGLDPGQQSAVTGDTLMHVLASRGNEVGTLLYLLKQMHLPVRLNSMSETLLHVAAKHGHLEMVKALAEEGFDLLAGDRAGQSPLHLACSGGHFGVARFLLSYLPQADYRDERSETPLLESVKAGSLDIYKLLLEKRANVLAKTSRAETALHLAAVNNKTKMMEELLQLNSIELNSETKPEKNTALHLAVLSGQYTAVQVLMKCPTVDIARQNQKGDTPITLAAKAEAVGVLELLLKGRRVPHKALSGPMLEAVACGSENACKYLICCRVDLRECVDSEGNNALHKVARHGSPTIAQLLLDKWPTENFDRRSRPAEVVKALMKRGSQGMTPCVVADVCDHEPVSRLFMAYLFRNNVITGGSVSSARPGEQMAEEVGTCVSRGSGMRGVCCIQQ